MANSALFQVQRASSNPPGHDIAALGPSNSSDSGSDVAGLTPPQGQMDDLPLLDDAIAPLSDTDGDGTGERRGAVGEDVGREASDISPDRIVDFSEQGEQDDQEEADEDDVLADRLSVAEWEPQS